MAAQAADAGDGAIERAAARPGQPVAVVQAAGAVDTDPDIDPSLGKELAPGIVDQGPVGLERVGHPQIRRAQPFDHRERVAVERDRQHHRLAGMPHHRQPALHPAGCEHLGKQIAQGLRRDDGL